MGKHAAGSPHTHDIDPNTIHAVAKPKSAYRRWYASLHPSLQLIGMQLWMPVFMLIMFCICYVGAFHFIALHNVPVAVVAPHGVVAQYDAGAQHSAPGAFDLHAVSNVAAARQQVLHGDVAAAVDLTSTPHTLYVARAHQAQAAELMPSILRPLFATSGSLRTVDIAPLPIGDIGMTPMYLMLAWCISGYLSAMFIGMIGGPLRHRTRFLTIGVMSGALSLLAAALTVLLLHAISGHFLEIWGLGWAWSAAVGIAANGMGYFFGRFIAVPAMTLFLFLSIPSSGAAMPQWLMPQPFQWLNHIVVGSGITEMLKRLIYHVGPGYSRGWIMLAIYAASGIALSLIGKPYWEWRRMRRIMNGKTTMFQDAQSANSDFHRAERDRLLAKQGLAVHRPGVIVRIDDGAQIDNDNDDDLSTVSTPTSQSLEHEWDTSPISVLDRRAIDRDAQRRSADERMIDAANTRAHSDRRND